MPNNNTLIELCTASIVNFVKAQDNQSLPHRLPEPVTARKSTGHDGRWVGEEYKSWPVGEVKTNIDMTRWTFGVNNEDEEFVFQNACRQIAAYFGCTCYFSDNGGRHQGTLNIEILPLCDDQ